MTLYEFRLKDESGKVSTIRKQECETVQEAINVGLTFAAEYHLVEIWADGQVIIQLPRN
jgi:hypothetical protein